MGKMKWTTVGDDRMRCIENNMIVEIKKGRYVRPYVVASGVDSTCTVKLEYSSNPEFKKEFFWKRILNFFKWR